MTDEVTPPHASLMTDTVDIVSAYVAKNAISAGELPNLIASVHAALAGLTGTPAAAPADAVTEKATPAEIKKSITKDALISFIDGKPYKTLKRHLSNHGLEPASYRARYGLPADYPMTSPSYSQQRSDLAKALGLGRPRRPERVAA